MHAGLGRIIIYGRRILEMIAFYQRLLGYTPALREDDRIVELRPAVPGQPFFSSRPTQSNATDRQ
jgi:hypothetical protein